MFTWVTMFMTLNREWAINLGSHLLNTYVPSTAPPP